MSTDLSAAQLVVRRAVDACLADLPADACVLIGVSGGADSLALARGAVATGREVVAGIVDHGLQSGSGKAAEHAAAACSALGITRVLVERVTVVASGIGPEAAARNARRSALQAMAESSAASAILLAHTRDDQAETVLLRLARGSGARSLAAMAVVSGPWRRPLLDVPRDVVRASVADLAVWEDPHNVDHAFARTRVRRVALPALVDALGPGVVAGLARSARALRDDADALDAWAGEVGARITSPDGSWQVEDLAALPRAVRSRIIRSAILAAGASVSALTAEHIDRVDALITRWRGQGPVDLPGGLCAEREYGRLRVRRVPPVADRRRDDREE